MADQHATPHGNGDRPQYDPAVETIAELLAVLDRRLPQIPADHSWRPPLERALEAAARTLVRWGES